MSTHPVDESPPGPELYEIRLRGRLDAHWASWFDEMTLEVEPPGVTVLRGPVADQAALHGLLGRLRDLGLPLISLVGIAEPPPR